MNQKVFKRRVYIAGLIFALLAVTFIIRLFNLHFSGRVIVSDGGRADVRRGPIKDRNGYLLALSIEKHSVFANPEEIKNPEETARLLSRVLSVPAETILNKFKKKKRFIWIKRKVDDSPAEEIRKSGLPGLYLKKEYARVYPHENLASNIVGFVGMDGNGLAGVEYNFNGDLSTPGEAGAENPGGLAFGRTVTLTIDRFIQDRAEKEIGKAVSLYRAKQGAVLVMEVKTGRILALAKSPGFNPNRYYEYAQFPLRNFSFIDSFEPGSTMKILSLASMLEHNPAILNRKYTCRGYVDIADVRINCTGVHGTIAMGDIIRHSCNVGVIEAVKGIKKKDLYDTLQKFRFGRKTGVEMPGETEGILRPLAKWSGLSKYSIAIGQEIAVTSVQLAAAFCAVANGGVYTSPSIIKSIENHDGTVVQSYKLAVRGRVITRGTSEKLMSMMRGVVSGGTGQKAASSYFCVAGKTGTSQKFVRAKGYSDRVLSTFIGLAPCENPDVCILVIIDDPADKLSGGQIATPVFAGLVDRVLTRQGVGRQRLKARAPVPQKIANADFDGATMPDFRGMRMPDSMALVIRMKKRFAIRYSLRGTGTVLSQQPAPGAPLDDSTRVILEFKE
jgi:cell division protein FtsI/penicillin-binding protein 2